MINAIIIGYVIGTVTAFFVSRWFLRAIAARFGVSDQQRKSMMMGGVVFGLIALAPAIFMGVLVGGGSPTGGYTGLVSEAMGLGAVGEFLVLSLGIILITTITVAGVAAVGASMGFLAARKP
jgi:hypothetical protein